MTPRGLILALVPALLLWGCDGSSPSAVEDSVNANDLEELAVAAMEAAEQEGLPLPSLQRLLQETYRTVRAAPEAYPEGLALLRRARLQARQAREALAAGDEEAARAHQARSEALALGAVIVVLGPDVPAQALGGVEQALARLDARLAGQNPPERFLQALDQVRNLAARGQAALEEGNPRGALKAALVAADRLRALVPRYQAQKAIHRADRAFQAAYDLVVAGPTDAEVAALRKARRLLAAAKDAYRSRDFRAAVRLARESAELSLDVLAGRSGG